MVSGVEMTNGQLAYEEEIRIIPTYPDGGQRPTWNQLCSAARDSWERHPIITDTARRIRGEKYHAERFLKAEDLYR